MFENVRGKSMVHPSLLGIPAFRRLLMAVQEKPTYIVTFAGSLSGKEIG